MSKEVFDFDPIQYRKYTRIVEIVTKFSNTHGGAIFTAPYDESHNAAYVTVSVPFIRIGHMDKEETKELIDLSDAIAIDSVEPETISILIGIKRFSD